MKYLILFTLIITLVSCSKKEKEVSPPANISVYVTGVAPTDFSITLINNNAGTQTTLYAATLNTIPYTYAFYTKPGSLLKFDLHGPKNMPLRVDVTYNGTVVATESNANFPDLNEVTLGYTVPVN
jgi:hypothetical protein